MSSEFDAGLGFYCHAFDNNTLQDASEYEEAFDDLVGRLSSITRYAVTKGLKSIGIEQMYTPHQIPWTIEGSERLIRDVYTAARSPLYITIDTGHQTGQKRYLEPGEADVESACRGTKGIWLGPSSCNEVAARAAAGILPLHEATKRIKELMDQHRYLYANKEDSDTYAWLEKLGCYSPIIHLQQTNGNSSSHLPFTDINNRNGNVSAKSVLQAIARSYQNIKPGMPHPCETIYLTLELFFSTGESNEGILSQIKESVNYWRSFVKKDGVTLSEIIQDMIIFDEGDGGTK